MKRQLSPIYALLFIFFAYTPLCTAQFSNFEDTWKEFLSNDKTSNISKLVKPPKDQKIEYAQYSLMYANTYFCGGDIEDAEGMMDEILSIGPAVYSQIPGYKPKYEDLVTKIEAYHQVEKQWSRFLNGKEVTLEDLEIDKAEVVCEKGTLAKFNYMLSYIHYCLGNLKDGREKFEKRVLKLAEHTTLKLSDVRGLEEGVAKTKKLYSGISAVEKAWKKYLKTGESSGFDKEIPLIKCNTAPNIKAFVLKATLDICDNGKGMLAEIEKLQKKYNQKLSKDLQEKIDWLSEEVGKNTGDEKVLNKAWDEFVSTGTLEGPIKFGFKYCRIEDRLKAYVMDASVNFCEKGEEILQTIAGILKEEEPELSKITENKIKDLVATYQDEQEAVSDLEEMYGMYISDGDTLTEAYDHLAKIYCDQIAQCKYWVIEGGMNACKEGQSYLDKITTAQKDHQLEFDEQLECAVLGLKIKVYDCRYAELVRQARKETHMERERFGPSSAGIMQKDLNSDKQPCETKVAYSPLGNIGIKYTISTYLCQDVDLAKMGDPEYYSKIANWVDTEVLQKYCETDMRCKEDFFIYLEGHTDGHAFRGARYKKSLEIPEGTAFTHYTALEASEKVTEREITNSLRSNMELGIARAWTVKNQLDFMGVPITIGAYEHPDEEKGGEYRKIEIELNITNLLLDFYGKRLNELLEASGIGERAEACS